MKKLLMFVVGALLLVFALSVLVLLIRKDRIVRRIALEQVEEATGLVPELDEFHVNLLKSEVTIQGFRLRNPESFQNPYLLEVNEISSDIDLFSLLGSTLRLHSLVIDIPALYVETAADGQNNLRVLQQNIQGFQERHPPAQQGPESPPKPEPAPAPKASKELLIEQLEVRLGKAQIVDYSRGTEDEPARMELVLDVDRTYRDVSDSQEVVLDLLAQVLQRSLMEMIGDDVENVLKELGAQVEKEAPGFEAKAKELETQFKGFLKQFK